MERRDRPMPVGMDANGLAHPLRTDSDGRLEIVQSGGRQMLRHVLSGNLGIGSGALRYPNSTGRVLTIIDVALNVGTAPTGQAVIVDVNLNGTTIFTTPYGNGRATIAAGAYSGGTTEAPMAVAWADGSTLTFDVDQVGSGTAGANLVVTVVYG